MNAGMRFTSLQAIPLSRRRSSLRRVAATAASLPMFRWCFIICQRPSRALANTPTSCACVLSKDTRTHIMIIKTRDRIRTQHRLTLCMAVKDRRVRRREQGTFGDATKRRRIQDVLTVFAGGRKGLCQHRATIAASHAVCADRICKRCVIVRGKRVMLHKGRWKMAPNGYATASGSRD